MLQIKRRPSQNERFEKNLMLTGIVHGGEAAALSRSAALYDRPGQGKTAWILPKNK
jgi:hypothetical protein